MTMNPYRYYSMKVSKNLITFFTFLIFPLINSRLDPDMHHDGIMYTAALGASNGMMPNRDFFAQYGFGAPFIQGFWMQFTSDSLLSLRVFTAIQLAIVAQILFFICKRFLPFLIAFLIAFTWIIQLSARIPWASIPVAILSLLVIVLLLDMNSPQSLMTSNRFRLIASGFTMAVACTFRLQALSLIIAVSVAIIFFQKRREHLLFIWIGFSIFMSTFITYLLINSALVPLLQQSITWPSSFYKPPELSKSLITDLLWYPLIFLFITCGFRISIFLTKSLDSKRGMLSAALSILILALLGVSILREDRIGYLGFQYPKVILIDLTSHLAGFLGYWSAVMIPVLTLVLLVRCIQRTKKPIDSAAKYVFLLLSGLSVLPQLYPLHDQVHLWYITPMLVVGCLPFVSKFLSVHNGSKLWVSVLLIVSSTLSTFVVFRDFQKPRLEYTNIAMQGLLGSPKDVPNIDQEMKFLEDYATTRLIGFDCQDGMYAGAGKRYLSNDPMYVNWGPERIYAFRDSSAIFGCKKNEEELQRYLSYGFDLEKIWYGSEGLFDFMLTRKTLEKNS